MNGLEDHETNPLRPWNEVTEIWNESSGENLSSAHVRTIEVRALDKLRVYLDDHPDTKEGLDDYMEL